MVTSEYRDEQVIEAIGKCRIVIRDGKAVTPGDSQSTGVHSPGWFVEPIEEINPYSLRINIENRVRSSGILTGSSHRSVTLLCRSSFKHMISLILD